MNIEIFHDELNARFLPHGKLNVVATTNIPGQPMPRWDSIWMVSATPSGVDFHITGLQSASPLVTADVISQLSLNYPLGTETYSVMLKCAKQYSTIPAILPVIRQYADFIYDAYQVALAYDKASILFAQYNATNMTNPSLLIQAWQALKNIKYSHPKVVQLANAIKGTAETQNVPI